MKKYFYLYPGIIILLIAVQFYNNISTVNQSGNHTFEDYSKSILNSTQKNSLILSYQWDYFISPAYYFQYCEGYRKDVAVVDKELLRRSWYFNQLKRNHPEILEGLEKEIALFQKALVPFERSENFDSALLENLYKTIMSKLVLNNYDRMTIYIAPEMVENEMQKGEFTLPDGYSLVPDNLLFRVVREKDYAAVKEPDFKIRFFKNRNRYIDFIENMAGTMLVRRGIYELQNNKLDTGRNYINKVKTEFPNVVIPQDVLQLLQ